MNLAFILHWKIFFEYFPTKRMLNGFGNPFRQRLTKPNANILDVGCGQSPFILDLIEEDFTFTAFDSDESQLKYLENRISEINPSYSQKVNFQKGIFPSQEIHYEEYDAIIFNNLFHFLEFDKLIDIFSEINNKIKSGAYIFITVHSDKNVEMKKSNDYFKHLFSVEDIECLFPKEKYEYCEFSSGEFIITDYEKTFYSEWIKQVNKNQPEPVIKHQIQDYLAKNSKYFYIETLLKKLM